MVKDIAIVNEWRRPLDMNELRNLMEQSWGERGLWLAGKWGSFNEKYWQGKLVPLPIWLPSAPPYGRWFGLYSGGPGRTSHHIQIKRGLDNQSMLGVLLHEMTHQYLYESGQESQHNSEPWCDEIMRLTKLIWGRDIWASPSQPRKVDGKSVRVQKTGPNGEESLPLKLISTWPDSLRLSVPA